jgi:hypothetical protein
VPEVGQIIHRINKGGVHGLELLGLVRPWEKGTRRTYKMGNFNEVRTAFSRLYRFLDKNIGDAQKLRIVFEAIIVENSLCKYTRVSGGE